MLYSFSKLNNQVTDYLIDKITFMKDSSFHNITMQIRKDCILSIDYGLPNIVNDGFRKAIEQKNNKAIDVFLGVGSDPEIARGVIIDDAIKNNDYERLKLITQHHKFDLSEYTKIPEKLDSDLNSLSICNNIILQAQQDYLNSPFSSIHKMEKEQLKELIYAEIDSLDYHKTYQNLTTLFTCMRRFGYTDYKESLIDMNEYALEIKNDYAITALAVLQKEQVNFSINKFIKYAIETKNLYLLDLLIDDSRIDLIPLVPIPKFLFKEDDNLFMRPLKIKSDSTLGDINKLFKEEFRELNFNNSIFQQYQNILKISSGTISLIVPTLSKDYIDTILAQDTSLSNKGTYTQRVSELMKNQNIEWTINKPLTVSTKDDSSDKKITYAERAFEMVTQESKVWRAPNLEKPETKELESFSPIVSKEQTQAIIQKRRIDSIVLPPPPIVEKVRYKAEPKIPYKHILNTKNEIVSMVEIQKKWDTALIAETFNLTGEQKTMRDFIFKFAEENNTSWHSISHVGYGLKRIPFKGLTSHLQCEVPKFVENYIPKLHKLLKNKTKDEVFEKIDKYLKYLDYAVIGTQRLKEVYETTPRRKKTI